MVPLLTFARIEPPASGPVVINHNCMLPAANLSFNLAPGVALGQAVAALQDIGREIGMPTSVHGTFQDSAQASQASLATQPLLKIGRDACWARDGTYVK